MLKVLVLSYHFPPLNLVGSYRALGYANHFKEFGIHPTIVTHHWTKTRNDGWIINDDHHGGVIESTKDYDIIRLPCPGQKGGLLSFLLRIPVLSKVGYLILWFLGYLDSGEINLASYKSYKNFLTAHLKSHTYDYALAIYSPHHHLRLCHYLKKRFGLAYIIDFRDLWRNSLLSEKTEVGFKQYLKDKFCSYYWRKWIGSSEFFTSVSDPLTGFLQELSDKIGYTITHGYDDDISASKGDGSASEFVMCYSGSLSLVQRLDLLGEGIKLFSQQIGASDFKVVFLGSKGRTNKMNSKYSFLNDPTSIIAHYVPINNLTITTRVEREEVLEYYRTAHIMLLPSYPGLKGTYSGKLFEYLGTGKNIMIIPTDDGVIEKLVNETSCGFIANTPEEAANFLVTKYNEWKTTGKCSFNGDYNRIKQYSRVAQVKKLAELIKGN